MGTQKPLNNFHPRLLQRAKQNRRFLIYSNITNQVQCKCGFPNRWPRCDDYHFAILKPCSYLVQIGITTAYPTNRRATACLTLVNTIKGFFQHFIHAIDTASYTAFCNIKHFSCGLMQQFISWPNLVIGIPKDFITNINEGSHNRAVTNNMSVVHCISSGGGSIPKLGQCSIASNIIYLICLFKGFGENH